jgi:hypothetical protein
VSSANTSSNFAQIASNQSSVFYDKFNETHSFSLLALGGLAGVVLVASGGGGGGKKKKYPHTPKKKNPF